jgi:hypothetical protein
MIDSILGPLWSALWWPVRTRRCRALALLERRRVGRGARRGVRRIADWSRRGPLAPKWEWVGTRGQRRTSQRPAAEPSDVPSRASYACRLRG